MKEKKTIYAIIVIPRAFSEDDTRYAHVYSHTTSNKELLKEHAKKIAKSHKDAYKTYLMPREEAKKKCYEINNKIHDTLKKLDQMRLAKMNKGLDDLYIRKIFADSMKRG